MPETKDGHTDSVWARVDAVVVLILENERYLEKKRSKELTDTVKAKFKVSKRTAERYISEAKSEIKKIGKVDKKKAFIKAIRDREFLITKTKNILISATTNSDKIKAANQVLETLKDRDKLQHLYVDEIKHSGSIELKDINFNSMTSDQRKKLKLLLREGVPVKDALLHIGVIIK